MGDYNKVFQRYEKKYVLSREQYRIFCEEIKPYMRVDIYGKSTICNIYYDTADYHLIRASLDKPIYKEKMRLRSYNVPEKDGVSFLEIKKKYAGVVYKRRVALNLSDAYESIEKREVVGAEGQIANEMNYFMQHYSLKPVTYLAYDRIAMEGIEDTSLRMTFDFSIRSRQEDFDLSAGDYGENVFDEDIVVLEIKVLNSYPFWLISILEKYQIYPASLSKYGEVYKRIILPESMHTRKTTTEEEQLCFAVS